MNLFEQIEATPDPRALLTALARLTQLEFRAIEPIALRLPALQPEFTIADMAVVMLRQLASEIDLLRTPYLNVMTPGAIQKVSITSDKIADMPILQDVTQSISLYRGYRIYPMDNGGTQAAPTYPHSQSAIIYCQPGVDIRNTLDSMIGGQHDAALAGAFSMYRGFNVWNTGSEWRAKRGESLDDRLLAPTLGDIIRFIDEIADRETSEGMKR